MKWFSWVKMAMATVTLFALQYYNMKLDYDTAQNTALWVVGFFGASGCVGVTFTSGLIEICEKS